MDGPARRRDRERQYSKIGEVARALDTTPSAIRFYLSRFSPYIRPTRSKTHRQLFSRRDVQVLKVILILRREYGLSVRDTLERLQDLLVTHNRDPFAIEREIARKEPDPETVTNQGELPFNSPPDTLDGVREPCPAIGASVARQAIEARDRELAEARRVAEQQTDRIRSLEHDLARTREALQGRDDDLARAHRTIAEQSARIQEIERALRRLDTERNALRHRVVQAVRELLLEVVSEVGSAEP